MIAQSELELKILIEDIARAHRRRYDTVLILVRFGLSVVYKRRKPTAVLKVRMSAVPSSSYTVLMGTVSY